MKEDFYLFKFLGITIIVAAIFAIIGIVSTPRKIKPIIKASPNSSVSKPKKPPSINLYRNPRQTNAKYTTPVVTNRTVIRICAPDSLLTKKVIDWAEPTIFTLTNNIIIAAGHNGLNDVLKPGSFTPTIEGDGTNGINKNTPVFYEGKSRSLEGAVNLRTANILQKLLQQAGFNVIYVKAKPSENLRSKMERIKKMISGTDTFAFEIHYDAPSGPSQYSGSGVIPPNIDPTITVNSTYADVATSTNLTNKGISGYNIALAQEFGAYPQNWRNGLGGPRRGVTLLEIDKITKVEPFFRKALKNGDYTKVDQILTKYASRVVKALFSTLVSASQDRTSEALTNCSREGYKVFTDKTSY